MDPYLQGKYFNLINKVKNKTLCFLGNQIILQRIENT